MVCPLMVASSFPGNRVDSKCAGMTTLKLTNISERLGDYSVRMWRASSSNIIGIPSFIGKASLHGLHANSLFRDCKSSSLLHIGHTNISSNFLSMIIFKFLYDGLYEWSIKFCGNRQKPTLFKSSITTFYCIFFGHYDDVVLN